jgi:hypothetical protein
LERGWRWLVIVDDDTLLSVGRLLEFIRCYDRGDDFKAAMVTVL